MRLVPSLRFLKCATYRPPQQPHFILPENAYLFFGKETKGLPEWLLHENPAFCARLPMLDDARARSLNLSNTVAVAVYEVLRQWGFPALLCEGQLREYED